MREEGESLFRGLIRKRQGKGQTYAESVLGPDDTDQWIKNLGNLTAPVGSSGAEKPGQKPFESKDYQFNRADSAQTGHKITQHQKAQNQETLRSQMGSNSTPRSGR